ncbi:MAG TPA: rhomboid family intramembrane serine protease [Verrucomicrobiae bacterium]|jgi:membrane associated rhomboid family serine protease|nr:rhomboid family intramembrane serine protease [Verrucomicrobiae bacterium]
MALADRHYMRQPSGGWRWSATLVLIVLLIVAFFVQYGVFSPRFRDEYLTLSLEGIKRGFVWQLLTFQFLHASLLHIALNCWTLYLFGREVESALGKSRFVILYFSSGVIGGLFQVLFALLWPNYFSGGVVGASAGIFGIVATFATLFPHELLSLFLIPIRFKARTLLIVSFALAVLGLLFPATMGGNVAHAAHLGGMLTGIAWVKLGWHHDYLQLPWERLFNRQKSRSRKSELIRAASIKIPGFKRAEDSEDLPSEEFISREVDPILDKISQQGIQSLTERERKILESARNKMAKR